MLRIFDLDGTLIESTLEQPRKPYETVNLLPGRLDMIRALRNQGHAVAIVTNQGGAAFGYHTEMDTKNKLIAVARAFEFDAVSIRGDTWYETRMLIPTGWIDNTLRIQVCCAHPTATIPGLAHPDFVRRRKPSPVMLLEACKLANVEPEEARYIGDSPEDVAAAHAAGMPFTYADSFFTKGADHASV